MFEEFVSSVLTHPEEDPCELFIIIIIKWFRKSLISVISLNQKGLQVVFNLFHGETFCLVDINIAHGFN